MFIAILILTILSLLVVADNIFGSYWGALIIIASFIVGGFLAEELEDYLYLRHERKEREREEREKVRLEHEKQETSAKVNELDDDNDDDDDEFDDLDELDYPDIPAGYLIKKPKKNRPIKRNKTCPLKRKKTRIEY